MSGSRTRVFVSSVVEGFAARCPAARKAIKDLGGEAVLVIEDTAARTRHRGMRVSMRSTAPPSFSWERAVDGRPLPAGRGAPARAIVGVASRNGI